MLDWTALTWIFFGVVVVVVVKTCLEGSVDHITNRDYTVNRSSFIFCIEVWPVEWKPFDTGQDIISISLVKRRNVEQW